ncbi:hypothetical protein ACAG25_08985 [Mycobacterium sp. pV006]|uniref:hypothetical protein n=1 Tax=Mycobacterium sp. pV006 TaxID=3238983 RepID=UPI00351B1D4E
MTMLETACGGGEVDTYPVISRLQEVEAEQRGTSDSLYGAWEPSDGTSTKTFNEDGRCRGFYYVSSTGEPLDIGGAMTCQLSSKPDSSGRYRLSVTQGPNSATYLVEFNGADAATVYSKSGKQLYQLSRF